jgi:hypothetical protein
MVLTQDITGTIYIEKQPTDHANGILSDNRKGSSIKSKHPPKEGNEPPSKDHDHQTACHEGMS